MVGVRQVPSGDGRTDAQGKASSAIGRYVHGLDGLRAAPMLAVFAYHAGLDGFDGAFLGLSLFFTLSGYLITSLILRTHESRGRIGLRTFWGRRYRRLLPAAYLTLAGVVVFGATIATEQQLAVLPQSIAACLAQVANWYFILSDTSYVALFSSPSPVHHFWSLAVEEQFYLAFPLGMAALLGRTRSMRVVAGVLALGALASTALTVTLFETGASIDRIYLGTDTRAAEILVGCVLAVVLHRRPLPTEGRAVRTLPFVGALCGVITLWSWHTFALTDAVFYRGGFLVFSLVSVGLIVSVLDGRGPLSAALSWAPMAAFGRITYGVYLIHWPLILWLTEERTGLSSVPLLAVRLVVTVGLASLSYNLIEMPIRNGAFPLARFQARWIVAPTAVALLVGGLAVGQRDVETDLAGLGTGTDASAIPAALAPPPDDGTLDVLVISDQDAEGLADELDRASTDGFPIQAVAAPPFECTAVDPSNPRLCRGWSDDWTGLVEAVDPEVVLFQVSRWDTAEIAGLSGADDLAGQTAWTADALGAGFDLLTAGGAVVVWGEDPLEDMAEAVQRPNQPFYSAMLELTGGRSDARRRAVLGRAIEPLVADLSLYQPAAPSSTPRVMVVGDSTAQTMAYGLERWAARTGDAIVWSAATEGCGIADEGRVRDAAGRPTEVPGFCREPAERWAAGVAEFDPDVVLVMSQLLDLQPRRLDEWPGFLAPGDETFDDYLLQEYRSAYAALASQGARVVWFNVPCSENTLGLGNLDADVFKLERVEAVNRGLMARLADAEPGMELFDLFSVLCPDGAYVEDVDGVSTVRIDGVHFSTQGSDWFADTFAARLVDPEG